MAVVIFLRLVGTAGASCKIELKQSYLNLSTPQVPKTRSSEKLIWITDQSKQTMFYIPPNLPRHLTPTLKSVHFEYLKFSMRNYFENFFKGVVRYFSLISKASKIFSYIQVKSSVYYLLSILQQKQFVLIVHLCFKF